MKTHLAISGMRSVHAVRAIYTALTPLPGIVRANVAMGEVVVEHDGRASCEDLRRAVSDAGFEVTRCTEDPRALPTLG